MRGSKVRVIRVYITEGSKLVNQITHYLNNELKCRGVSVFRAISGYGDSGEHTSSLIDLSIDLPLVIECFDEEQVMKQAITYISTLVKSKHILYWDAYVAN